MSSSSSSKSLTASALLLCLSATLWSQDSISKFTTRTIMQGYVRTIGMIEKFKTESDLNSSVWLHARVNVEHSFSESIRFRMDLRTQIIYARNLINWPGYKDGFSSTDASMNLHALWWKRSHSVAHSNVERLALAYRKNKNTATLGRQRINWGMALTWNPNDVFQAGNPFDPDYVERPGVDAMRFQRSTGSLSGFDFAFARIGPGRSRGAWRYYANRSGYDWQAIIGWYDHQPTMGMGFAGNLGNWSFRSESQAYIRSANEMGQVQVSLETDRLFPQNNYVKTSFLYNQNGMIGRSNMPTQLIPQNKQLMPGRYSFLLGWNRTPSLRFQYGADLYYTTANHSIIFFPRIQYALSADWQIALFIQLVNDLSARDRYNRFIFRIGKDFMR